MTRKKSFFRPGIETLEDRCTPAGLHVIQVADAIHLPPALLADAAVPRFLLRELLVQRAGGDEPHLGSEPNGPGGQAIRRLKALGDMNERLRQVSTVLRRDLATGHFEGPKRLGDVGSPLHKNPGDPPDIRAVRSSLWKSASAGHSR